jgi:hypothetical protein
MTNAPNENGLVVHNDMEIGAKEEKTDGPGGAVNLTEKQKRRNAVIFFPFVSFCALPATHTDMVTQD